MDGIIALICHARSILIVTFSQGEVGPQGLGREGKKGQRGEQVSQILKFPLSKGRFVLVRTEIGHFEICRDACILQLVRFQFLTFKPFIVPFYS